MVLDYDGIINQQVLEDPVKSGELLSWSTSQMTRLQDSVFPFLKPLLGV